LTIAAILLAAGRSLRFGEADKLAAPLGDLPLGLHAARTLATLPFMTRLVVTGSNDLDWSGFRVIRNEHPTAGMAHSIGLGVRAAERLDPTSILIALADMPFVSPEHFRQLIDAVRGPATLVATSSNGRRMPPGLFGRNWFGALTSLTGDQGARGLLDHADTIVADPDDMLDVDSIADLGKARARLRS
jgi:molybdenum cofactor cytidylyltransferase